MSATNSFNVVVSEVNRSPMLTVPADATIEEDAAYTANATATDDDLPTNALTFELVSGPTRLTVSSNGEINWTPDESQGSSTNTVTISVTDTNPIAVNATSLSVTSSFEIVVSEVNVAPELTLPPNTNLNEMSPFTAIAAATDADIPTNALTFAKVSGPANLTVSSSGVINWTPEEDQGPSTNVIIVRVTDDSPFAVNSQQLSMTNSFTLIVNEVNVAPLLILPPDTNINEMASFTATASATDADIPTNTHTFAKISGPANLTVASSGVINWTPDESQGPSTNTVTVSVTDTNPIALNATSLSVTDSFKIVVSELNLAPVLGQLTNRTVNPGQTINFTTTATDGDLPTNALSFDLINPPAGASIKSSSGQFDWRPGVALADTTNSVQVRVQDNGSPVLSDTQAFTVVVNPLAPVVLSLIGYSNEQFRFEVSGMVGPDYVIMAATNVASWFDLATNLSPFTPFQFEETNPASTRIRFYRLRLEP